MYKFLIVGVGRNVGSAFTKTMQVIEQSFSFASQIHWFVVESDSDDNTLKLLDHIANLNSKFRYISCGKLSENMRSRTARIAYCRNKYLDEIRNNSLYQDIDYVVVVDLDGINDGLTAEAVISCWDNTGWDAVFANQDAPYYDVWALRHSVWCPADCWEQYNFFIKSGIKNEFALYAAVISKMVIIPKDLKWIPVESAFGGLGIYRMEVIASGTAMYQGLTSSGIEICDCVPFNTSLSSGGSKLFINPKLINGGYNEHTSIYKATFASANVAS